MQLSLCCPTACRTTLIWFMLGLSVSWNKAAKRNFVDKPNVLYNLVIRTGERVQLWTNHGKKNIFDAMFAVYTVWPIFSEFIVTMSTKKNSFLQFRPRWFALLSYSALSVLKGTVPLDKFRTKAVGCCVRHKFNSRTVAQGKILITSMDVNFAYL